MQIIKKLCTMIEEELHDSEKYIDCALYHKDSDRELADLLVPSGTDGALGI